jgi:hypothetical protein
MCLGALYCYGMSCGELSVRLVLGGSRVFGCIFGLVRRSIGLVCPSIGVGFSGFLVMVVIVRRFHDYVVTAGGEKKGSQSRCNKLSWFHEVW